MTQDFYPNDPDHRSADLERFTHIIYAVHAAALAIPLLYVIGVILAFVKREDARGTWLESHYTWLSRTFWYSLGLLILAGLTFIIGVGILMLPCIWLFWIYRIIKGWVLLRDRRPIA